MSNIGLENCLTEHGIQVVRTDVGDKYVVEAMRKGGYNLGGEQSGHVIFLDHSTTGDGTVAALNVLSIMRETNKKISELTNVFEEVPQVLINCRVRSRVELDQIKGYQNFLREKEESASPSEALGVIGNQAGVF